LTVFLEIPITLAIARIGIPSARRSRRIRQVIAFRDDGQEPCEHVAALLQRRAAEVDARIAELQQLRGELDRLARRAATLDPEQCRPERVCHVIA
jgi:DNA-binding transcriptional MerR regulator